MFLLRHICFTLALLISFPSFSQSEEEVADSVNFKDSALRNLSLITDLGIVGFENYSGDLPEYDWVNSKGLNISFFRSFALKDQNILLKLGVGISTEGYKFKEPAQASYNPLAGTYLVAINDSTKNFIKSKIAVNYFDIPAEFQFQNNWLYPIKFSIGGKIGYLFDAHNKQKYEQSFRGVVKEKTQLNSKMINRWRAAIYMRLSLSHFGIYGQYSLHHALTSFNHNSFMLGVNYLID